MPLIGPPQNRIKFNLVNSFTSIRIGIIKAFSAWMHLQHIMSIKQQSDKGWRALPQLIGWGLRCCRFEGCLESLDVCDFVGLGVGLILLFLQRVKFVELFPCYLSPEGCIISILRLQSCHLLLLPSLIEQRLESIAALMHVLLEALPCFFLWRLDS